jgi:hypothetical protein
MLATATGCRKPEMKRCVDQDHVVVDDDLCHARGEQRILGEKPTDRTAYRYYYGGSGSAEPGTIATDGSYVPDSGHTYAVASVHRRDRLRQAWPVVGLVAFGALFFFLWEGRRKRI